MSFPEDPMGTEPSLAPVTLTGGTLTIEQVARVARERAVVVLSGDAMAAVQESSAMLERIVRSNRPVYGVTTGVGALDATRVTPEDNRAYQRNLLRSHAAGIGHPMSTDHVRAMMLARANVLARGLSGVQLSVVDALLGALNRGVVPIVPESGSVGASDLSPLAHMALVIAGEGWAKVDGEIFPGREAMEHAGVDIPELGGRDALALINGLAQTTGIGALAVWDAVRLVRIAEAAAAMVMVATRSVTDFLDERLAAAKLHRGNMASARRMRELVAGARSEGPSRTPLSIRYAAQVTGATRDAVALAERAVTSELNAGVDNPTLFPDGWYTNNSANTSGQAIAEALDMLASSIAALAVASERRTARLLDATQNGGLPAFLIHPRAKAGLCSGLMIAQYTAASLVAELRMHAAPAAIQSITTSAGEDLVSMSALAARRAASSVATAEAIVAIELLVAAQAVDLAGAPLPEPLVQTYEAVRFRVPILVQDRIVSDDIHAILALIRTGELRA